MSFADVPVGTFLSGGVDSSAVTAALAKPGCRLTRVHGRLRGGGLRRAAAGARGRRAFRRRTSAARSSRDDVEAVFRDTILWHYDEPFNDYSYLPTYYVCREARASITVALSGDGGDELFGGYGKYTLLARRATIERRCRGPCASSSRRAPEAMLRTAAIRARLLRYEQGAEQLLSTLMTGMAPSTLRSRGAGRSRKRSPTTTRWTRCARISSRPRRRRSASSTRCATSTSSSRSARES